MTRTQAAATDAEMIALPLKLAGHARVEAYLVEIPVLSALQGFTKTTLIIPQLASQDAEMEKKLELRDVMTETHSVAMGAMEIEQV